MRTMRLFFLIITLLLVAGVVAKEAVLISGSMRGTCTLKTMKNVSENRVEIELDGQCLKSPPGTGTVTPEQPPEVPSNVKVVKQSLGPRTYLPNCTNGLNPRLTNCAVQGSFQGTQPIAVVYPTQAGGISGAIEIARTELRDDASLFLAAISLKPGDFDVATKCKNAQPSGGFTLSVYSKSELAKLAPAYRSLYCAVEPGKTYYLNIRSTDRSCSDAKPCRTQVLRRGLFLPYQP